MRAIGNRQQVSKSIFLVVIMILMTWSGAVSNDLEIFEEYDAPIILEDTPFIQKTATAANTFLVKDIDPPGGSTADQVSGLVKLGDYVYFSADDGTHGRELWRSDGTTLGTTLVKDIRPGGSDSWPLYLTVMGSEIYFRAHDGSIGTELWKSDGTEAGTVLVKNINPSGNGVITPNFHVSGNTLYFQGSFGSSQGEELWKSDGTELGTVLVKDINPGIYGSSPSQFSTIGSKTYFVANDATHGRELWETDGTGIGTTIVKDINPGSTSGIPNPSYITAIGSNLYFRANAGSTGSELWISDGTSAGTNLVSDIDPGSNSGAPQYFTQLGSNVLFSATDTSKGRELWITDGTGGGTERVKNIYSGSTGSSPNSLLAIGSMVYFEATDGSGTHLWKTGGTQATTNKISSVPAIDGSSHIVGTTYYASFSCGAQGSEFGKYQASTETFTGCIEDLSGTGSSFPTDFTQLGEKLLFTIDDSGDRQLWVTNILGDLQPAANLDYNATQSAGGSTSWTEVDGSSFEWDLTGPTRQSISGYPNLQHAYRFDGIDDSANLNDNLQSMSGDPTDESASFEVWINPDDLTDDKVIWEIGGESNGASMVLWNDLLTFRVKTGSLIVNLSHTITDDNKFHQVVGVVNTESSYVALYYDGVEVGQTYVVGSIDWSGNNKPGLGSINDNVGAYSSSEQGDFSSPFFDGDIAIFRFYEFEMVPTQIQSSFELFSLQAPIISYSPSSYTLIKDVAMSSATPTNSGGAITSWAISPAISSGLNFDTSTGVISGTPTVVYVSTVYTITATNSGGSDTATVTIVVNDEVPSSLAYSPNSFTLTKDVAMSTVTPTISGGAVTSWAISPAISSGLNFDTSTGVISGTPTVVYVSTVYTITATNSGGSDTATVTIVVNDEIPSFTYPYSSYTFTKDQTIPTIYPTNTGGHATTWETSGLPNGLAINSVSGYIWGIATTVTPATTYTIYANNSGGSDSTTITITVNNVAPNTIVYSSHDLVLEKGTAMTTTTPAISGGSVTTWEISPSIPSGLTFSSSTGAISGTPSILQTTSVTYTIWANNSGGWTSTEMNITINDQLASVSYPSVIEISNDRTMTAVTPTTSGGAITSWEISPSLPSSLNFGSSNGSIWG
ncbi:MAG: hypothetical protein HOI28_05365, partial [Euryarchaeota archaeon]|nr:hypothetical protein [Euryarchaeota archaeon]